MSNSKVKKTDKRKKRKSLWENLPAILAGLAALVTAIGGCIGIFLASPGIVDFFFPPKVNSVAQAMQTLSPMLVLPTTTMPSSTPMSTIPPTATSRPTTMPSSTPISTIPPTATSRPTPIPTPTVTPSCATVSDVFAATWSQVQSKIGCAQGSTIRDFIAEENFQSGKMFWREPIDFTQMLVLFNDGTWKLFEHAPFVEGKPEYACVDANTPAQSPPTPRRGFGLVWCDIPEVRIGLGNATDAERGYTGYMQGFDNGFMVRTNYDATFVFYNTGKWERK